MTVIQGTGVLYTDPSRGLSQFFEGLHVHFSGEVRYVSLDGHSTTPQEVDANNAGVFREALHAIMDGTRWWQYGESVAYLHRFREARKANTGFPEEPSSSREQAIPSTKGAWQLYEVHTYKGDLPLFRGIDFVLSPDEEVGLLSGYPNLPDEDLDEGVVGEEISEISDFSEPTEAECQTMDLAATTGDWSAVPQRFWPNYMRNPETPGSDGSIVQKVVLRQITPPGRAVTLERIDQQRTVVAIRQGGENASYEIKTAFVDGLAPEIIGYRITLRGDLFRGVLESLGLDLSNGAEAIEKGIRSLFVSGGLYNEEQARRVMDDNGCQSGLCNVDMDLEGSFLSLNLRRPQGSVQFLFSERLKDALVAPLVKYCLLHPVIYEELML